MAGNNELLLDTSETLPGGIRVNTETRSVDVSMIPFIRSRKVYFKMQGLLPNMRHRPFFDGVDVTNWCREEVYTNASTVENAVDADLASSYSSHPATASALVSDSTGTIEGSFFIPNNAALKFRSGRREFKVLDWSATTDQNAISKAYATYYAQGLIENRVTTVTTIYPAPPPPPVRQIDPVAQSFVVEKDEGYFVTAVDVAFSTKSTAGVPVRLQIRPVVNGVPTGVIVPKAEVMKDAASVNVTSSPDFNNPSTYTTFTFDTPVYLNGLTEYAIVILAESDQYEVWTAVTTEFVVGSTAQRIMKQPAMGSFFKSQNGSTWTPDQSRDLTFRVKTARFSVADEGTAYFENAAVPSTRLGTNPIEFLEAAATPRTRIRHPNHGLYVGSKVTISGAVGFNSITSGNLNTTHDVTEVPDLDHYVIEPAGTSSAVGVGGGTVVQSQGQIDYTLMFPVVNQLNLSQTGVDWSSKLTNGKSVAGAETPFAKDSSYQAMAPNTNATLRVPKVIASQVNETNGMAGVKSATVRAKLFTTSKYLTPIIDLNRASLTVVNNRIDRQVDTPATGFNVPSTFVAETDPVSGSSASKHIFIPVTLEEAAVGLKVLFGANRPSDSYIELYYKAVSAGSETTLQTTPWVLATIDEEMRTDDNPNTFREYVYTIDGLQPFTTFQFKLVFKSKNSCHVPLVKDFRAIALAT